MYDTMSAALFAASYKGLLWKSGSDFGRKWGIRKENRQKTGKSGRNLAFFSIIRYDEKNETSSRKGEWGPDAIQKQKKRTDRESA